MLIGGLITVLILQLCTASSRLSKVFLSKLEATPPVRLNHHAPHSANFFQPCLFGNGNYLTETEIFKTF